MNINLHIERLILDGAPIARSQGAVVQAAVEAELAQLLATGGLKAEFASGAAVALLRAIPIQFAPNIEPQAMGAQIAGAVYHQLGGSNE